MRRRCWPPINCASGDPVLTAPPPPAPGGTDLPAEVLVPGGPFTMGTSAHPWALDNERPAHQVQVPAFWLDTVPVTNGDYQEFIAAGGYHDPQWWHPEGWRHRQQAGVPRRCSGSGTGESGCGAGSAGSSRCPPTNPSCMSVGTRRRPTPAGRANGCRRNRNGRRPPGTTRSRHGPPIPMGRRRRDRRAGQPRAGHLQPAPVGAYPAGASPLGIHQLIGDVWEWTSSDFAPYPGFAAWPYREYSEVFFGPEYKVLRGGSFAADRVACRGTFRNWDYPIRRQIFAGFRCARDAAPGEG